MADLKISELNALSGANLASADELAIVDDSASETKKITVGNLIENGVTLISDDTIPGAKILFAAGDIATAALADSAVTTAKIADDGVTGAKLADESTVDLVTTLPASGAFTGQLALDTDDNKLYLWNGTSWLSVAAAGSVNTVSGSTTGEVNIVSTVSGDTVTISATLDDTTAASQFLAGPTGSAGAVGYRAIDGNDLPVATTSAKGGVIVNGEGLRMDSNTIEVDNDVTASSTHHVVTYNAKGLVTGGRIIASSDLPIATTSARGAVIASDGLAVDASGNLSIDNAVTSGTYTKVTVTAQGVVSAGETLTADDIPDHSAAKLTSGTIGSSLIANDAVTASKLADQSTMKFGGATGTDGVTIFPTGDFQGQLFFDETSEDLYFFSGSAFVPITVISGNLVNAGTYNASTNLLTSVTTLGSGAGFTAGSALPAPSANNLNHYVVVDTSGTGTGAAPGVALAPPDMLLSQGVGTEFALIDVSNAIAGQTASNISVVPTGNISADDVQAAIQELDNEKVAKAGDTMTGDLNLGDGVVIVFEGSTADDYETTLTVADPTADRTITLPDVTGTVVTTGDTGSVTSTMITDGTIVNADINASAEIAVSKLANGTARQLLQTDAGGTGVEFTSNVDVPGTLDVTDAGTFDSTVSVAGLLSADGKLNYPAGTAAAPSLYSGSDTDTGIYAPASDEFGIATGGTSRVVIDSSGNIGIGTTTVDSKLHVVESTVSGKTTVLTLEAAGAAADDGPAIDFIPNGSSLVSASIVGARPDASGADGYLGFYTNNATTNSEKMRIDSSGNVGIGLTNISGSGSLTLLAGQNLKWAGSGGNTIYGDIYANDQHNLIFRNNNGTERMRIDSSGNVAIGTASPHAITGYTVLTLNNSSQGGAIEFKNNNTSYGRLLQGSSSVILETKQNIPIVFGTGTSSDERMRIDSSGNLLISKSSTSFTVDGTIVGGGGYVGITRTSATPLHVIRNGSDGTLVSFEAQNIAEGSISVSGTTVSYNGAHLSRWSQLPGGVTREEILRGTVLSNIDEMCDWGEEENEQLNRMQVSDVEGDKNVAGVFQAWDDDDDTYTNDFYCAMTGDFVIRIAQGTTVARGDLLMSAGDGTAKPQDDDIIRSKTIAKVTSTHVSETYADGSYCVPCVLMAC